MLFGHSSPTVTQGKTGSLARSSRGAHGFSFTGKGRDLWVLRLTAVRPKPS